MRCAHTSHCSIILHFTLFFQANKTRTICSVMAMCCCRSRGGWYLLSVITATLLLCFQVHQGDEEDEEDWAREQLRKGVGLSADQRPSTSGRGAMNGRALGGTPAAAALAARPQSEAVASAGEEVLKALRQGLARLQAGPFNTQST